MTHKLPQIFMLIRKVVVLLIKCFDSLFYLHYAELDTFKIGVHWTPLDGERDFYLGKE